MKTPITNPIASLESLIWVKANAPETPIVIRIGVPYQISAEEWACPAELQGVDKQYPDVHGTSSLQALGLAIHLVRTRLCHLLQDGERILYSEDRNTAFNLNSISSLFGNQPSSPNA